MAFKRKFGHIVLSATIMLATFRNINIKEFLAKNYCFV